MESQEKKSLEGDAEALAFAAEMREGNAINRARIDTLEEAARDIGAYEEGELTEVYVDEQTLTNISEKYGGRAALRRYKKKTSAPKLRSLFVIYETYALPS